MKKTTKSAIWAIIWLAFLVVALIFYCHSIFMEWLGGYAATLEGVIVVAAVTLAYWLWNERDVVAKVSLASSEANKIFETVSGAFQRQLAMSLEDFQKSSSVTHRSVSISEAILNRIRTRMDLWGNNQVVVGTAKDALLMKWVFENEYVPKDDIAKAVHERLCEIGRGVYEWHIAAPLIRYPDHSVSPEALGYAILHGAVSVEEARMIRFDHGETADEYRKMAEGLHESVVRQLAAGNTYFSIPKLSGSDDCCCECCS